MQSRRLNILISAYACEPNRGSEPGVGWNLSLALSEYCDVTVITRSNNQSVIEQFLDDQPQKNIKFVYYDVPKCLAWWKKGHRGVHFYYYLWQIGIFFMIKRLGYSQFDLIHHVTFGRYWSPSFLALLPKPFIWGVVGGGEKAPLKFWPSFGVRGFSFEILRYLGQKLGEIDPFTRLTARRAKLVLVTTMDTYKVVERLGAKTIKIFPQVGLTTEQIQKLSMSTHNKERPFTFISIARPIPWKGIEYGLKAFEKANVGDARYIVLSKGKGIERIKKIINTSEKRHLIELVEGVDSLDEVYSILRNADVLVHLAFHEAFGNVVLEAGAANKRVITLDVGGAVQLNVKLKGLIVKAANKIQIVGDIRFCMESSIEDSSLKNNEMCVSEYMWGNLTLKILDFYRESLTKP